MRALLWLIGLLMMSGCFTRGKEEESKLYFDLGGFLTAEIERLAALDTCVTKVVSIGDSSETQVFQHADTSFWKQELSVFFDADINAAAYRGLYEIEQEMIGVDSIITFRATANKPPTRWLKVLKNDGEVVRIDAERETNTVVYSTLLQLTYLSEGSYYIKSTQETRGAPTRQFVIQGSLGCTPVLDFQF